MRVLANCFYIEPTRKREANTYIKKIVVGLYSNRARAVSQYLISQWFIIGNAVKYHPTLLHNWCCWIISYKRWWQYNN